MALRVWLPLNKGNIINQGLSSATITGTPSYTSNGKIGAYALNGGTIQIKVPEIEDTKICTFSFWAYITSSLITSNWTRVAKFNDKGTNAGSNMRFEVCPSSYSNGIYCFSNHNNTSYGLTTGCITSPTGGYYDQWVHFCFTSDGTVFTRYMNGVKIGTCNYTGEAVLSGDFFLENNDKCFKQDVRVYDHCLSPKEVKEISKGLVAHYKLEASNINTNLAVFNPLVNSGSTSISFDRSTNTYTLIAPVGNSTWGYGVNIGATNKCIVPYNSYYRFSFEVYVPTEHVLVVDYNNYSNNSSVASWNGNDNDLASARLTNTKTIPANTWTKCVFGSQNAHANNTSHIDIYEQSKIGLRTASDTGPVTWYLRNFKFELDNKATDYVPCGYDPMEFLTTDVSGNGYHIKLAGNLLCNNDSIRYSTSTIFDNVNTNYLYRDTFNWLNSPYTFNCWVYQTSATTTSSGNTGTTLQFIESQGRDCGYAGFSLCSANGYARLYIGTATTGTYYTINDSTINLLNNWHMLTGTYDGTTAKLYVDGVLKGTKETSIEPVWTEANGFTIGKMAYGHTNTAAYFPFVGSISDARVYATALTADDILTLYKTSGIIDNKGNIYAYEFKEE